MNVIQALNLAKEGYKVRPIRWEKSKFYYSLIYKNDKFYETLENETIELDEEANIILKDFVLGEWKIVDCPSELHKDIINNPDKYRIKIFKMCRERDYCNGCPIKEVCCYNNIQDPSENVCEDWDLEHIIKSIILMEENEVI